MKMTSLITDPLRSMIKLSPLCCAAFFYTPAYPQPSIFINPVQPSGAIMHYQDLWNLNITKEPVNLAMGNPFYFLEIEISDTKKSLRLWKAHTQLFHIISSPYWITPGNPAELEPVEVVFSNPQWSENITLGGGLFPPGEYTITYRLLEPTAGSSSGG